MASTSSKPRCFFSAPPTPASGGDQAGRVGCFRRGPSRAFRRDVWSTPSRSVSRNGLFLDSGQGCWQRTPHCLVVVKKGYYSAEPLPAAHLAWGGGRLSPSRTGPTLF